MKAINFPTKSLSHAAEQSEAVLSIFKSTPTALIFSIFWKCKLAKKVWPHLGWCIGPCGAGLAEQHGHACCSLSCVILEKSPNTLVTAVKATCCCTAQAPCLLANVITCHNNGVCPLSVTQMIFSYEWKWKSKWEETQSPTKTPSPCSSKCGSI